MVDLLKLARESIEPMLAREASSYLGEPEGVTRSAVGLAIPAVLGGLVREGSTASGATRLLGLLDSPDVDASPSARLGDGGGNRAAALARAGESILQSLFGDRLGSVAGAVASASGLGRASVGRLLALVAPLVLGLVKRQVQTNRLDASGLASLLLGQRDTLRASLGDQLSSAIGLSRPVPAGAPDVSDRWSAGASDSGNSGMRRWLPWAALGLFALVALPALVRFVRDRARTESIRVAQEPAEATRGADLPLKTVALPNGTKLQVPAGGLVDSLVIYLSGPSEAPGKRFVAEDVRFEPDSARLTGDAHRQLEMLAGTLKAYPTVTLRVEGQPAAGGDPTLAAARAHAVETALVELGIPDDRLEAVAVGPASGPAEAGRGPDRPIAFVVAKR